MFLLPKNYIVAKRGLRRALKRTRKTTGMFKAIKMGRKIKR